MSYVSLGSTMAAGSGATASSILSRTQPSTTTTTYRQQSVAEQQTAPPALTSTSTSTAQPAKSDYIVKGAGGTREQMATGDGGGTSIKEVAVIAQALSWEALAAKARAAFKPIKLSLLMSRGPFDAMTNLETVLNAILDTGDFSLGPKYTEVYKAFEKETGYSIPELSNLLKIIMDGINAGTLTPPVVKEIEVNHGEPSASDLKAAADQANIDLMLSRQSTSADSGMGKYAVPALIAVAAAVYFLRK